MSDRIERLKRVFLDAPRTVDVERARIVTEVSISAKGEPPVLRRALVLDALLRRMTIEIRPDELLVGNHAGVLRAVPLFPEYAVDWLLDQMDDLPTRQGDRFQITEAQKTELRSFLPYWRGRCLRDQAREATPPELASALAHGVFCNENYTMSGPGHMSPDYTRLLASGLGSVAATALAASDPDPDSRAFRKAAAIVCRAMIAFAHRYADLADGLAAMEPDEVRRAELAATARVCRRVPEHPAATLHEAVQFVLFIQLGLQIEANGLAIAPGRLDRILFPYYERDRAEGRMNEETAVELLACLFLKFGEIDKIYSNQATRFLQGPAHGQCITLGGTDAAGNDATNDMTYLILAADRSVGLVQPDIALRIHPGTPQRLLDEVVITIRSGLNKIKVFNDNLVRASLEDIGVAEDDAWDFAFLGCSEPVIPGRMNTWGNSGHINLAKCLELALNDGKCMGSGIRMGPETGDPAAFAGYDEVRDAFRTQVRWAVDHLSAFDNIIDRLHAQAVPLPLYSVATRDCVERGVEFNSGGAAYNTTSPLGVGPITAGDSLAAVKRLVFDERRLSMAELVAALKSDFAGNEALRLMLVNRAPKFGNDDDEADARSNEVLTMFCDELARHRNPRGGPFVAGLYYLSANIPYGRVTAATPDGRHAGEPLNDGGVSPNHGMDRNGATAVARSVGKLDNRRVTHGCVLNQRFHPSVFAGDGKERLFADYIRAFVDLGGWECQYNVITGEALREAQRDPARHRHLVIRVAGYCAYFTELERELQEDIINRTELSTV